MEIVVHIKDVYGNSLVYPVCEKAKLFANIAGTKTLTIGALNHIAALGFDIVERNTLSPTHFHIFLKGNENASV